MSEIRVNNVIGEDGGTPVNFSKGINISSGVVTATTFKGNVTGNVTGTATGLGGAPDITTGVITISDATESTSSTTGALKVSGGVGIAKSLYVGGNITAGGTVTYEDVTNQDVLGLSTFRGGVQFGVSGVGGTISAAGNAEFAGIVTAGITALDAISEQLVRIDGNTATIAYNSGGANIGYCSNPTGDITLNVTGIPTSSFDNQALTFSLIVDNSTAAAAGVRTVSYTHLTLPTKA